MCIYIYSSLTLQYFPVFFLLFFYLGQKYFLILEKAESRSPSVTVDLVKDMHTFVMLGPTFHPLPTLL